MKKLLLILLCLPFIGFGQDPPGLIDSPVLINKDIPPPEAEKEAAAKEAEREFVNHQLGNNRNPTFFPPPLYDSEAEGLVVVVHIIVDKLGNVIFANAGGKGSTTLNKRLLVRAKEAALKTKYLPKADAPNQHGKIIYTFQKN